MNLIKFLFVILALIAIFSLFFPQQFENAKEHVTSIFKGKTPSTPPTTETDRTTPVRNITDAPEQRLPGATYDQSLTVANWNLQIFGPAKSGNTTLLRIYADIIRDYDIIFIQEIRDASGLSFPRLCAFLQEYYCNISSRAGRTTSKEQYGVITRKDIELLEFIDYNPDSQDRWERPPISVLFSHNGYEFTAYNIHAKPTDAPAEIRALELLVTPTDDKTMVIGDLNADCSYYRQIYHDDFSNWFWLIRSGQRTNIVGRTPCAYDRIIVNRPLFDDVINYGIRTRDIDESLSDHYLVWVHINTTVTV